MEKSHIPGAVAVRVAETQAEREAIYALRYQVYVRELKKANVDNADHAQGWIRDPEDDQPQTILLYSGPRDAPAGTMRLRVWAQGEVDQHTAQIYSLARFPDLNRQAVFEISRLIVSPSVRSSPVAPSLFEAAYRLAVGRRHAHIGFLYCAPGLSRAYHRLGFRGYQGELIPSPDGLRVPMVMIAGDLEHFQKVGSPLTPLVQEHFPAGSDHHADTTDYRYLVEGAFHPYELDPAAVWREMQESLVDNERPASVFLDKVPPEALKRLADAATVMEAPAGAVITREKLVEEEMFLVLSGEFQVLLNGQRLVVLRPGDIAGELALFLPNHQRTANIEAVTPGRLVVIGRKFMATIKKENPALAAELLENLCRIMASRQAATDVVCYATKPAPDGV
ncbi:MAG: cyclic nucleotide-binding domain-containing protein [Pseudomonadota bacterium]